MGCFSADGIAAPVNPFVFPKWSNLAVKAAPPLLGAAATYAVAVFALAASPQTTDVGYQPDQPVPYSHRLHAGELGIDCRYCHNTVEIATHAALPPTQTCMNCHKHIRASSEKLLVVRESYGTGMPIEWVRIHDLPGYAYFNHSAHVRRGVGCVSCHGRIDKMDVVYQAEKLSMGWCLDCHRNPDPRLRPLEYVTKLAWIPEEDQLVLGKRLREEWRINPSEDCSTCHR
ncbi:MAG: cytochrome c3 family protein [Phycisphaerae bacterium]|nr:cytochrome c3 family protein [Phycisphaerae bacterium]